MPTELQNRRRLAYPLIGGLILLAVAPWLLFPTVAPAGTALALLMVAILWLLPWLTRREPLRYSPFNGAFLLWEVGLLVGIVVTADPDLTLPKATGLILGLTMWRYLVAVVDDDFRLRAATFLFLLVCLGFMTLGIFSAEWRFEISFLDSLLGRLPPQLVRLPEAPEPGVSTNQLAGVVLFCLPLVASLAIGWRPGRNSKPVLIGLLLIIVMTSALLILTQSRSGWIGGLTGIFALPLLWSLTLPPSKRRILIRLSLVALVALVAIGLLVAFIWIGPERLREVWEEPPRETPIGTLSTISFRTEVWQWALIAVQDFPFTGTGLGTFRRVVHRLYPITVAPSYDIAHAHNIFLQVALDTGLPGLIAYLSILAIAFVIGYRLAKRDHELRPLAIGLLAALVAIHAYGLTDALAPGSKPGLLFWMLLGILAAMERLSRQKRASIEIVNRAGPSAQPGCHVC